MGSAAWGGSVYDGVEDIVEDMEAGGFLEALVRSWSMILVSEMGDETFIIAAILAMRHPRSIVFAGAIGALVVMTVLSAGLGMIVPNLVSKQNTHMAATALYTFFGVRLLWIAWKCEPGAGVQGEIEEVEGKLEGGAVQGKSRTKVILDRIFTPIFVEAFVLTFLAEWGDRSQIATITLATHKDPVGVMIGGVLGHAICTGVAVCGGRLLALKISQRTVAVTGGVLFLLFALHNVLFGVSSE